MIQKKANNTSPCLHTIFLTIPTPPLTYQPQAKLMKDVETGGGSLSPLSHGFGNQYWFISYYRIMVISSIPNLQIKTIQLLEVNYHPSAMNRLHIFQLFIKVYKQKNADIISVQRSELLQNEQTEQHADRETTSVPQSHPCSCPLSLPHPLIDCLISWNELMPKISRLSEFHVIFVLLHFD